MINLLFVLIRTLFLPFTLPRELALENLALRQQLTVYKRLLPRPQLWLQDRLFWIWLSKTWSGWRESLIIVKPDTVLNWHRKGFKLFWTKLSWRTGAGRPAVSAKVKSLIKQMAASNPL